MNFKRILSLLLVAMMLMASFASWAVIGTFAAEGVTILTPAEAGMKHLSKDAVTADNYSTSLVGWMGFGDVEMVKFGYSIDDGNILWEGGQFNNFNTPEEGEIIKNSAGSAARRFQIVTSLVGVPYGDHVVHYYTELANGNICEVFTQEITTKDPSAIGSTTFSFNSAETPDLKSFFKGFDGAVDGNANFATSPYALSWITHAYQTMDGTYEMNVSNINTVGGGGAMFFRGNPNPNFGDANYYGTDNSSFGVGCAGIYATVLNGALGINVRGVDGAGKAVNHLYSVAMSGKDIKIIDDNKAVRFYEGNTLLATVAVSGDNGSGYATEATVTANGVSETLTDVCLAATVASDVGFVARGVVLTFDAVTIGAITEIPSEPETEAPKPEMPAEATNVALGATVTATESYEEGAPFFHTSFLTDGIWTTYDGATNLTLGWNSLTNPEYTDEYRPVSITISLDKVYTLYQLIIKPMMWSNGDKLPRDFNIQVSLTGADDSWTTVVDAKDVTAHVDGYAVGGNDTAANVLVQPITYVLDEAVEAQYIRLNITRHSAVTDANGSYNSSIGEIEAWGVEYVEPFVKPETPAEIVDAAYALEDGATLAEGPYTLTGVITSVDEAYNSKYGNITVTIKVNGADETKLIKCFRMVGEGIDDLIVGDTITVTGDLTNWSGTIEFATACTLDAADRIERPEPIEYDAIIEFVEANRTEGTTDKNVYIANGITVTNNKANSTTNVRQDADHIRIYANSELIIEYPGMTQITFNCTGGSKYYIPDTLTASVEGTWAIDGAVAIYTLSAPADSITFAAMPNQVRLTSIGIMVADIPEVPAEPEMWDIKKDIVMHQSFDELRINGTANGVFAPGASAGWDFIANLDESVEFLQYWGWVATASANIGTFGYSINGGKATFDPAWTVTPEFTVGQVFPTAANATRMLINIDIADLVGENDVTVYYMDDEGKITILNTFKVVKPEEPEEIILDLGANAIEVTDGWNGTTVTFYAIADGIYTFSWADGETNGFAQILGENWNEEIELPYTVELNAYDSITLVIATADYGVDTIDLVVTAEEPPVEENILDLGANAIEVTDGWNGTTVTFYAIADGIYTFSWADGETNGFAQILGEYWNEEIELPYTVELNAYDSITLVIATADYGVDTIDLVVTAEEPAVDDNTLILGSNAIEVTDGWNGTTVTFYAKADGIYTFSWADGETNGFAQILGEYWNEEIELPYTVELNAYDSISLVIATADFGVDTIDLVVSGEMPEEPQGPALNLGANSITVPATGITVTLTAPDDGVYTFKWADGEINGVATMIDANGNASEIALPLEVTVEAGETVTIVLGTVDFAEDTIDIVVEKKSGDIFDDDNGKGCFGVVGSASLIALIALLPAAYVLRRKDEE